jgi:hypothetical protein
MLLQADYFSAAIAIASTWILSLVRDGRVLNLLKDFFLV